MARKAMASVGVGRRLRLGSGKKGAKITLIPSCLVAALPDATEAGAGARGFVTDADSAVFNAAAVGGSTNAVPVFCTGSAWKVG